MPVTPPVQSTYDLSAGRRTGRYSEALVLAERMAGQWPDAVELIRFGTSPEGRPMVALAVGRGQRKALGRPVVFFQAGIHPGEIEGKDAGFRVLDALLEGKLLPSALERVTILFVPALNCDGHERMSAHNRPNQRGPEEMGWRTTAQNFNLNRDYTKVDTPEMAQALRLMQEWDPVLFCDIHATDGAQFEHDVSLLIDAAAVAPEPLLQQGKLLQTELMDHLITAGHLPVSFYPSLRHEDRPEDGFELWVLPPRYSNGYWGAMRQRLSVLVETHSWRPYDYRVATVEHVLEGLLTLALRHGSDWVAAAIAADAAAAALAGKQVALTYSAAPQTRPLAFRGYAYSRKLSPASGLPRITYDETAPAVWTVPYADTLRVDCEVTAPKTGYVVPAAYAAMLKPRLEAHGLEFKQLNAAEARETVDTAAVWTFRAAEFSFAAVSFEGRTRLSVKGVWKKEPRALTTGSLLIPIAQAKARLALHLFEPTAPDSFLAWGLFNGCFEAKEMMESYIAEAVAEEMLKDPEVEAAFALALTTNPGFAASGAQRLEWFYKRHPAWDDCYALYPVYRLE